MAQQGDVIAYHPGVVLGRANARHLGRGQQLVFGRSDHGRHGRFDMTTADGRASGHVSRQAGRVLCASNGKCLLVNDSGTHDLVVRPWGAGRAADFRLPAVTPDSRSSMPLPAGLWTVRNGGHAGSGRPEVTREDQVAWLFVRVHASGPAARVEPVEETTQTLADWDPATGRGARPSPLTDAGLVTVRSYFEEYLRLPPVLWPSKRSGQEANRAAGNEAQPQNLSRLHHKARQYGYGGEADADLLLWLIEAGLVTPRLIDPRYL